jgi:hypothetical protein
VESGEWENESEGERFTLTYIAIRKEGVGARRGGKGIWERRRREKGGRE